MNDFDALLAQVVEEARALSIPVSHRLSPHVVINRRAVKRFGCCIHQGEECHIELTQRLLEAPEKSCRQTLAHEVLHTCPGCRNHGERWKEYAGRMNRAYGYDIRRTGSCDELKVPDLTPTRHLLVCQACGKEFPRAVASPVVRHPERYRCRCGGALRRVY